jgi:hypothetical protein
MDQHYPAGTILSCPSGACGLGLYRIVVLASAWTVSGHRRARRDDDIPWSTAADRLGRASLQGLLGATGRDQPLSPELRSAVRNADEARHQQPEACYETKREH